MLWERLSAIKGAGLTFRLHAVGLLSHVAAGSGGWAACELLPADPPQSTWQKPQGKGEDWLPWEESQHHSSACIELGWWPAPSSTGCSLISRDLGSPTLRVYVIRPRSQGHRQQPGQGSRCLDLEPSACVRGTPWPQLSGLFWAPSLASCLPATLPGAGEAVCLKVTVVVSWLRAAMPWSLPSQMSWVWSIVFAAGHGCTSLPLAPVFPYPGLGDGARLFVKVD